MSNIKSAGVQGVEQHPDDRKAKSSALATRRLMAAQNQTDAFLLDRLFSDEPSFEPPGRLAGTGAVLR